jgi:surfactin synthase thioesterase subunit
MPNSELVFRSRPNATMRIYCLPHGGGSATVYRPWDSVLPPAYELRALALPGWSHQEGQAPGSWQDLVGSVADVLERGGQESPFVLFGHCMGALVAYDATCALRRRHAALPRLLGLSGWPAEGSARMLAPFLNWPPDQVTTWLRTLGGIDDEVAPAMTARAMAAARFDMGFCLTRAERDEVPLPCPVAAYTGSADPVVRPLHMAPWQARASDFLGVTVIPGHHFYLLQDPTPAAHALLADIRRRVPARLPDVEPSTV